MAEENGGNGRRFIDFKFITGILLTALIGIGMYMHKDMSSKVELLMVSKVDTALYERDVGEIKKNIKEVRDFMTNHVIERRAVGGNE